MNPVAGIFMPWWGPAPIWVAEFIRRASALQNLKVILVGDAAQWELWADVPRIACTMDEFEAEASKTAGVKVSKFGPGYPRGQALCELRPMMADMYPDVIAGYLWWGWGDWDCVWGDWDSFLTGERLSRYDMISSCSYTVNGPFTIWRNNQYTRRMYRSRLDWVQLPTAEGHLDERGMQEIVETEAAAGWMRCLYPKDLDSHDRNEPWTRCTLRDNKLYRMDTVGNVGGELLNFHFPGTNHWPVVS